MKNEESILKELEPFYTPDDLEKERREEIRRLNWIILSRILGGPTALLARIFGAISDFFDDLAWFFY